MSLFVDQTEYPVEIISIPKKIISVVPSQTELLYDLGLDNEVIGITKFCVHPPSWFRSKTRVGGTKQLDIELIRELQPDLIIANKEENVKEQIELLQNEFPVWTSDIADLGSAYEMTRQIGKITGRFERSIDLCDRIQQNFSQLQTSTPSIPTAYLIWKDPYMTVGRDTFIHYLMGKAGFRNVFGKETRYPEVSIEMLRSANCELLLLSSEPYPFKQKHIDELQSQLPDTKILLVDGEMFSWYGSRLLLAPKYFNELRQILNVD